jgi:hypothetical protein
VKHFAASCLLLFGFCLGPTTSSAWSQPSPSPPTAPGPAASVILPSGTKIELDMMRPVWAATAKAADPAYAQVSFPAVANDRVAIPAGAYVLGTIESVARPTRRNNHAEIDILFTKIIFANGYTVELPGAASSATGAAPAATPGESLMAIKVQASTANDVLLDNGAQVEMTLQAPLALDANQVAQSIPLERAPQPQQFKSASLCRYIPGTPGTPGTPDTVIPGTPGTPSTTVPGGPGMPDITIPGTPGTPPTVIPGTPGTPGTPGRTCPAASLVLSSTPIVPNPVSSTSQPIAAK